MEFISNWVKNIVYIIIFIVFLEIILPNNSMRKYVKVVAGLLVMVVILTPFTQLFNRHFNLQDVMSKYYVDMNQIDVKNQNHLLEGQQNELTMKIYKERIATQIKNQVERIVDDGDAEVEVDVNMDTEDESYGEIGGVDIIFREKALDQGMIEPIEKIEISGRDGGQEILEEDKKDLNIDLAKENEIKELILDFYNVPIQNISINKQKNNLGKEEQSWKN